MPIYLIGVDLLPEKKLLPGRTIDSGRWLAEDNEINIYYRHSDVLSIEDGEQTGITVNTINGYINFDTAKLTGRFDYKGLDYYNEYAVNGFVTLEFLNKMILSENILGTKHNHIL